MPLDLSAEESLRVTGKTLPVRAHVKDIAQASTSLKLKNASSHAASALKVQAEVVIWALRGRKGEIVTEVTASSWVGARCTALMTKSTRVGVTFSTKRGNRGTPRSG